MVTNGQHRSFPLKYINYESIPYPYNECFFLNCKTGRWIAHVRITDKMTHNIRGPVHTISRSLPTQNSNAIRNNQKFRDALERYRFDDCFETANSRLRLIVSIIVWCAPVFRSRSHTHTRTSCARSILLAWFSGKWKNVFVFAAAISNTPKRSNLLDTTFPSIDLGVNREHTTDQWSPSVIYSIQMFRT